MIASPLKTIIVNAQQEAIDGILDIIKEYDVVLVVIGIPIGLKGNYTAQTKHVKKFADLLIRSGVNIAFQDERLSSVSAKKSLQKDSRFSSKDKSLIDQTAAAILLQQYIDTHYNVI